jgi:putative transposase
MSTQDFIWSVAQTSQGGAARSGFPEREPDSGRASASRSCAHVSVNSTQVLCGAGRWFHKGRERHPHIVRTYLGRRRNYHGMHFWARGYYVSTVGADEESVRDYIKKQEQEDARLDQLQLFDDE